VEKPDDKDHLLRHELIWKDNIEIDLKEIESGEFIYMNQDRRKRKAVVNMVINFQFP
jgi:hypothetical protein